MNIIKTILMAAKKKVVAVELPKEVVAPAAQPISSTVLVKPRDGGGTDTIYM